MTQSSGRCKLDYIKHSSNNNHRHKQQWRPFSMRHDNNWIRMDMYLWPGVKHVSRIQQFQEETNRHINSSHHRTNKWRHHC